MLRITKTKLAEIAWNFNLSVLPTSPKHTQLFKIITYYIIVSVFIAITNTKRLPRVAGNTNLNIRSYVDIKSLVVPTTTLSITCGYISIMFLITDLPLRPYDTAETEITGSVLTIII